MNTANTMLPVYIVAIVYRPELRPLTRATSPGRLGHEAQRSGLRRSGRLRRKSASHTGILHRHVQIHLRMAAR